ncbi:MAG: hypothetical protein LBV21_05365, partial [Candidatus Adiutrix sp.]|jgi:cell division protein FtsZ|nr:hypothetical protein [Candidatus Adiutrix sp.]
MKAVQGITELITGQGLVNVDFQDLKTVMTKRGPAIMGIGQATGDERARKAVEQAVCSPLLDDLSIDGAQGILINITGPNDLTLEESATICEFVTAAAHPEAEIFHGVVLDGNLAEEDLIKVTVIATGLGDSQAKAEEVQPGSDARAHLTLVDEPPVDLVEPVPAEAAAAPAPRKTTGAVLKAAAGPAASSVASGGERSIGEARRNRLNKRYGGSVSLGEDNYDIPTYIRHSPD